MLPVGTYGELRDGSGQRLASHVFAYGQNITADPKLPSTMPLGRVFTVSGENGDENSYRVYANHVRGGNTAVVAAPLGEIDSRLNRLLAVESLVILAVLLVLGSVAWAVVRVGLLPLDRMGHTAGAIAGGDLSQRVESTDPRTEVGRLGLALNAMLDRLERAFAGGSGSPRTGCAASSPMRRTSCARRWRRSAATPSCSGWAPRASRRRSTRRCSGSRTRRRAWACSSRTC